MKKMKKILFLLIFIVFLQSVFAIPISYDVTITIQEQNVITTKTQNEVKECDGTCTFSVPTIEQPENATFLNYTISNPSELIKTISFDSTKELTSAVLIDTITIETKELKEELKINKLVTKTLNRGQNNIVLQIENIGTKDAKDVYVTISGDGVKTISSQKIDIPKGQTDFTTTIVSITNTGSIDIIIKAYTDEKLLGQLIETISVPVEEKPEEPQKEVVSESYAKENIESLWKTIGEYEKDYLMKKSEEYEVEDLSKNIQEIKENIRALQTEYKQLTNEEFDQEVSLLKRSLDDLKLQISFAKPKSFSSKLKENAGLIATTVGAVVSALTALGLAKTHVLSKGKEKKK